MADITPDGLLIRETKFRKTRLVPLHDTTAAGLARYLARRGPSSDDDAVFIDHAAGASLLSRQGHVRQIGEQGWHRGHASSHRPRLHDLRHTFAVRALQGSPSGRAGAGSIWWRWRHISATSTSPRPTGIWRPPPTSCAISPPPGKPSCPGRAAMTPIAPLIEAFLRETLARHRGASQHTCDLLCLQLPAALPVRRREA